jgi:hypothetical protein
LDRVFYHGVFLDRVFYHRVFSDWVFSGEMGDRTTLEEDDSFGKEAPPSGP